MRRLISCPGYADPSSKRGDRPAIFDSRHVRSYVRRLNALENLPSDATLQFFIKHRNALLGCLISFLAVLWLWKAVGFSSLRSVDVKPGYRYLAPFLFLILLVAILTSVRWKQLLDGRLDLQVSFVAALLSLGGNMFLPARGGDLLRLHYTRQNTGLPWADLLGRLVVEKILDLFTVAAIGTLAVLVLNVGSDAFGSSTLVLLTASAVVVIAVAIVVMKFAYHPMLGLLAWLFRLIRLGAVFDRHIVRLIDSVHNLLTPRLLTRPVITTLFLWLAVYAGSYFVGGQLLGIELSYPEALVVLCVGTLGLMLPGAPSGVGTYHASVVSAFVILGRPAAEGLLFATAVHFLFWAALGLPVVPLYLYWNYKRVRGAWLKNNA
jgi:uncharacterized protein (TIRG00374 family)